MNQPKPPSRPFKPKSAKAAATGGANRHRTGKPMHALNLRAQVILLLQQVLQGQSLSQTLGPAMAKVNERDKALFNELVMGTLRHWYALDAQIQPMLGKPLSDERVHAALLLGLYQLLQTRIPPHAAISETVEAIRQLGQDKASGLVNALLRRTTREFDAVNAAFNAHHALPNWLYSQLKKDWPTQVGAIASSLREAAPLTLRVNSRQRSRSAYLQGLQQAGVEAVAGSMSPDAIQVLQSVQVPSLLGYEEGWFSVQDEHAQLCTNLLGNLDGKVVLDACAAPGGKTAHMLEKSTPKLLIALDHDAQRLERVYENLQRLQLSSPDVEVVAADASNWKCEQAFDAILLDAPCTATGVIRRHPDIRLLRQPEDVSQTFELQARLLDNLWQQLKPDGVLLYVTCSILKAENEQQVQAFLHRTTDAKLLDLQIEGAIAQAAGYQLLPQAGGGDGFYFSLIIKQL